MRFSDFAARKPIEHHRRLVLAVTTVLDEVLLAAEIIRSDGDVESLRERVDAAATWLEEASDLLVG